MAPWPARKREIFDGMVVRFDVSTNAHPDTWAEVDVADWPLLAGHRWSATKRANGLYVRNATVGLLHRFLLTPAAELVVDHRDGNPLNNRRSNLRTCTQSDNGRYAGDRWRGHSVHVERVVVPAAPHVVRATLADGSSREYVYPTRAKSGTRTLVSRKIGPPR